MVTSPISAEVRPANSKLAKFLRKREEDEGLLSLGRKKIRDVARQKSSGGGRDRASRWREPADFSYPSPMIDRPRTTSGSTSFHFSYIAISKHGSPTVGGKPVSGPGTRGSSAAVDHAKYIERDGAAESIEAALHAAYVERDGAVETLDPFAEHADGMERSLSAIVNEMPFENEASMLGMEDLQEGVPSIFSNISADAFEREEYWRAVHRTERDAKQHQLLMKPDQSPDWWDRLEDAKALPDDFRKHCIMERERFIAHEALNDAGTAKNEFKPTAYLGNSKKTGKALDAAMRSPGWNPFEPAVEFKSGRGGRVQFRFVAELPHEISGADRALIVQNFCEHLATLHTTKSGEKIGMMYTAVIHAPDAHNDRRNFHLHIVAHDRPASYDSLRGMWDFEYAETYQDPGSRKDRIRYPDRQPKLKEVEQAPTKSGVSTSGSAFVPSVRKKFAEITNTVLAARGIERRYDHRRYEEMGIDRTPTDHLGTNAAALEAIGVPTLVGKLNAISIWTDAERAIDKRAKEVDATLKKEQRGFDALATSNQPLAPTAAEAAKLRKLIAERSILVEHIAEDRRMIMTFDHLEAKAKSRAVRTRLTCLQFLTDIANGKADKTTQRVEKLIHARYDQAQERINTIDRELAPDRPMLARAAETVKAREDRIQDIDHLLAPLRQLMTAELLRQNEAAAQKAKAREERLKARETVAQTQGSDTTAPSESSPPAAPKGVTDRDPAKVPAAAPTPVSSQQKTGSKAPAKTPASNIGDPVATAQSNELAATPNQSSKVEQNPAAPVQSPPDKSSPLAAPEIGGTSIVNPLLDPKNDPLERRLKDAAIVADNLKPLKSSPEQKASPNDQEISLDDKSNPMPVERPAARSPSPVVEAATASTQTAGQDTPTQEWKQSPPSSETKVDDRCRDDGPTLFPIEPSTSPVERSTTRAEYSEWDAIINRISAERIPIIIEKDKRGLTKLVVPSLDADEQAVIQLPRFAARTASRLKTIQDNQSQEIGRLVRWLNKNGQDPSKVLFSGRSANVRGAPQSIKTLLTHWSGHEHVRDAFREEFFRREREANAKAAPSQRAAPVEKIEPAPLTTAEMEKAERVAYYEKVYPSPDVAKYPQVARFITLLRQDASPAQLQEAADEVRSHPIAREEVLRIGARLAIAYNKALRDDQVRRLRSLARPSYTNRLRDGR